MESNLPNTPFRNLAISLSGGGYRAASFHLGLLSYLSSIRWKDVSFLERVQILSTVSGGTFTGVCYATTIAEGNAFKDCYIKLYKHMNRVDLIEEGLKKLEDFKTWKSPKSRSLINAFSIVYFEKFEKNTFSILFKNETHLKEIIFNATEFRYGLPFRFQKTSHLENALNQVNQLDIPMDSIVEEQNEFAFLGNRQVNIPLAAINEIHLADIIASSSCFPMGFEPINFPSDFRHDNSPNLDSLKESYGTDQWGNKCKFPIGLMDGGIVANQGIDSVFWAEQRMRYHSGDLDKPIWKKENAIDLYIISDVSSPFMDGYLKNEERPFKSWRNWSFKSFVWWGLILLVLGLVPIFLADRYNNSSFSFYAGFVTSLLFLFGFLSFFLSNIFSWLLKTFKVPEFFLERLTRFSKLKFGIYETLIKNRISSVKSMVLEVFMKQIRRKEYDRVYNDRSWSCRLIMNAIYELTNKQLRFRNKKKEVVLSKELEFPSQLIIQTAERAKGMGTTLWFTPQELKDSADRRSMLNTLIGCGQFTICYNLMEYIELVLWRDKCENGYNNYSPELKSEIQQLYDQLSIDWQKFNNDPYWMVDEYNNRAGIK